MSQSNAVERISWFPVPEGDELPADVAALFQATEERFGFVPNALRAYAYRPERLQAWFAWFSLLHAPTPGLSAADREMIAVTVSRLNGCLYCLVAHGASLRGEMADPVMADRVTLDWRRASGLTDRERAICAFAEKITLQPIECDEQDLEGLRAHGLSDEDVWDVVELAAGYNFTNRLAMAGGHLPNPEYHGLHR